MSTVVHAAEKAWSWLIIGAVAAVAVLAAGLALRAFGRWCADKFGGESGD